MTPAQEKIKQVNQDLRNGIITIPEAYRELSNLDLRVDKFDAAGNKITTPAPSILLLLFSWGYKIDPFDPLFDEIGIELSDADVSTANQLQIYDSFSDIPNLLQEKVTDLNNAIALTGQEIIDAGTGTDTGGAESAAGELPFGGQWRAFLSEFAPEGWAGRRAFERIGAPAQTAWDIARLSALGRGVAPEEQQTAGEFLRGFRSPDSEQPFTRAGMRATSTAGLDELAKIMARVSGGLELTKGQETLLERVRGDEGSQIIEDMARQGVLPMFAATAGDVARRRIQQGEWGQMGGIGTPTGGMSPFERFISQGRRVDDPTYEMPEVDFQTSYEQLRDMARKTDRTAGEQAAMDMLSSPSDVIPLIQRTMSSNIPAFMKDAWNRVISDRVLSYAANNPNQGIWSSFVSEGIPGLEFSGLPKKYSWG